MKNIYVNILKNKNYRCILFLLLIGLLPLTWFNDSLIGGDDPGVPLSAKITTVRHFYIWDYLVAPGILGLFNLKQLPYDIIRLIIEMSGTSLIQNEMIFFYFWFTASGLSMFFLVKYISKNNYIASIASALFYMFNPLWFFFKLKWVMSLFSYSLMPLLLLYFIIFLETPRFKNGFYFSIVLSIISLSVNPAYLVVALIPIIFYFLYHIYINKCQDIWQPLYGVIVLIGLFFILNSYWIMVMIPFFNNQY